MLTFDNLGEASALERGTRDPGIPLGRDPSVAEALPRLLDALDRLGLAATFFVEAINCELNPEAVREIARRGHELGVHGWRHEVWAELDAAAESGLLQRSGDAFAALGLPVPRAFRPPGGGLTAHTCELLQEHGYAWCSPEGSAPPARDGLAMIPFVWDLVDAYHLMERFALLRRRRGDDPAAADPATAERRLTDALVRPGEQVRTLILHPFLMLAPGWRAGAERLLERLAADQRTWVGPGGRLAP